ncbi:endonuclease [Sulfolobus sp. E5-1-F]|uniref:Holliday junction resolvase Hjc n=1 Tax=Saccharolobus sp. E5-1-F TaxID=2663019 RepID=UPI001295D513|nr:Holliday junction resolvase Hjc [Sulfolobus sp. E5-1-F]QGA54672.1 endonuclease [Sulfolobus sp. E5-1-F]
MNTKKRKGSAIERNIVSKLRDKGFAVVRAPASGSKRKDSIPDIIALKNGVIILIEMKSSKDKEGKIYVRREQAEGIMDFARKSGGTLFLGVKKPGVLKFIPFNKLRRTETGNYVADSEVEGLDLEDLVRLVEAKVSRTLDNFL